MPQVKEYTESFNAKKISTISSLVTPPPLHTHPITPIRGIQLSLLRFDSQF